MLTENLWIIFVLVGLGCSRGPCSSSCARGSLATAFTTTGTVVALVQGRGSEGDLTYRPQVAFTAVGIALAVFVDLDA